MKLLIYGIILIALALIAYNGSFVDWSNLVSSSNGTAFIGILASLCVILLMCVLLVSKKIERRYKESNS